MFVIDTANGHSTIVEKAIEKIKNYNSDVYLMVGNVVTKEACRDLIDWGADSIRGLISTGAGCNTFGSTGIYRGSVTALKEMYPVCANAGIPLIADGGIRGGSDLSKALGCGASAIMVGSLIAGCKESPTEVVRVGVGASSVLYKRYAGSASEESKLSRGEKADNVEGVGYTLIPYQGGVERIINNLCDGLRSCLSYNNCLTLEEYIGNGEIEKISIAAQKQGSPHILG